MSRTLNFVSTPIDVGRLWSWSQPSRTNISKFANRPNDSDNLDEAEQPLALNSTKICSFSNSSGSSCTPEYDMSRILNFVSPPIDVGRLWSWSQPSRTNLSKFGNVGNGSDNLDKKEHPFALNSLRLRSFSKSSTSSCTHEFNTFRNVKFVSPPIDVGRLWSLPHPLRTNLSKFAD